MRRLTSVNSRRGITVLGLLLLIIALMVAGFFLVRYLRTRPAVTQSPPLVHPVNVILNEVKDPSADREILHFAQDDIGMSLLIS